MTRPTPSSLQMTTLLPQTPYFSRFIWRSAVRTYLRPTLSTRYWLLLKRRWTRPTAARPKNAGSHRNVWSHSTVRNTQIYRLSWSSASEDSVNTQVKSHGAFGFIPKSSDMRELVSALNQVLNGDLRSSLKGWSLTMRFVATLRKKLPHWRHNNTRC